MADREFRIASLPDVFHYDDADFDSAIDTDHFIKSSQAPAVNDDMVRLQDLNTAVANAVQAAAVITDHAIVRGDGGVRGVQDSLVTIDDTGSISLPALTTVDGRDLSVDGSKLDGIEALADVTDISNINSSIGGLVGLANNDILQWNDPGSTLQAKDIAEVILAQVIAPGNVTSSGMVRQANTWHAYGGFQDESETITISAVDTWAMITNGTSDLWTGLEANGMSLVNDILTIPNAGDYSGILSMSFSGLNGKDFQLRVYNITQAVQSGYVIGATTFGAGNFTNVAVPLYLEADAGDTFRMEVQCITDGSDPTFKNAIFNLAYLHD